PERDAQRHDDDAVVTIGRHGDRYAHHRIEDREGRPVEKAVFGIAELKLVDDRLRDDVDQIPIDEVECVDERQDQQDIKPIAWRAIARSRRRCCAGDRGCGRHVDPPLTPALERRVGPACSERSSAALRTPYPRNRGAQTCEFYPCCRLQARSQMSPFAFILKVSFAPTTRWSCTFIPNGASAFSMSRVKSMSAREGVGSPLGWL